MRAAAQRAGMLARLLAPKTTVRWRLTLLYGGLFLFSGAVMLAVTYTLVDHATIDRGPFGPRFISVKNIDRQVSAPWPGVDIVRQQYGPAPPGEVPPAIKPLLLSKSGRTAVSIVGSAQRISDLHQLVIESAIALAIMAVISTALGWVVAGRVLAPLRTMTATAQQISVANLHRRLAMQGPQDELRQLADTIDGLLERLEGAFDAQRRFVANASHELRTPLTTARALLEMVISDPRATVETFRTTCEQVLEEGTQQEQLIDALLALAQGQRGIDDRESLDLASIVRDGIRAQEPHAAARALDLHVSLDPAPVLGDRRLIERLASNLLENAVRHNVPGGLVRVDVHDRAGRATLTVSNTGPHVPAEEIERLLQPFQRLAPDRVGYSGGLGLGLSIVAAIAAAHDAGLAVVPGVEGGLIVQVGFAPVPGGALPAAPLPAPRQQALMGS